MAKSDIPRIVSDEIDPELVALRRPMARIGPVLVASVVVMSAYVMLTLRADFGYGVSSRTPRDLGAATDLAGQATIPENVYVSLAAVADRSAPARLHARQDTGARMVPVLGTSRRVWLQVEGEAPSAVMAYDEHYTGRLRPLADVAYADALREYLAAEPPRPHFLPPALLGGAVGAKVRDLTGDEVSVAEDTPLEIEEQVDGVAVVTVLKSEQFATVEAASAALAPFGASVGPSSFGVPRGDVGWSFDLVAADGVAGMRRRLDDARFYGTVVEAKTTRHRGRWQDATRDPASGDVRLAGKVIPARSITHAAVYVAVTIPADAVILVSGEAPGKFWYVPVLYGVLGLVSLLMIWALVRSLRRDR